MPQRVLHQVRDQALDQVRIAPDRGRGQAGLDRHPAGGSAGQHGPGDVGQVQLGRPFDTLLAVGEREQRPDQPLLRVAEREHLPARLAQRLHRRVRVGERDLQQRLLRGQRGPQLVRGVRHEVPLRGERRFQTPEELVQRRRQLGQLVPAARGDPQAAVQVVRRDVPRGLGHHPQRPQEPPGDHPAQPDRGHHQPGDRQRPRTDRELRDLRRRVRILAAAHRRRVARAEQRHGDQHGADHEERHRVEQHQPGPEGHDRPIR